MEFRLNYLRLTMPLLLFNIGTPFLFHDSNTSTVCWLLFALIVDIFFIFVWILSVPLVWIYIDQVNDTLTYQLFLRKPIAANLSKTKSQITTRRGSGINFRITEFHLYVHAHKVGTAQVPIWSINELEMLNQVISK